MDRIEDCYTATVKLLDGGEMTNEGTQDEMVKWVEYLMQCGETNDVRIIQKQGISK